MGNDMMEAYLFEMNTLLEQLEELVLSAEKAGSFSQDDVNEIFRIMHTIKGSSAMMEYNSLMTIAHRIEDLFFIVREKTMDWISPKFRPELFELVFQSIDFFRSEIDKLEKNEPLNESIDIFLTNINRFANKIQPEIGGEDLEKSGRPQETESQGAAVESGEGSQTVTLPGEEPDSSFGSGEFPYALHVLFDEGSGMENLRAFMLVNAVKDCCNENQFDFYPPDVAMNPDTAGFIVEKGFFLRFISEEDREKAIPAVTDAGSVRAYQSFDYTEAVEESVERDGQKDLEGEETRKAGQAEACVSPVSGTGQPGSAKQSHSKESLISVNLSKLDQLMAVVGEIVITESMVTASPDLRGMKLENFTQAARQLRSLTDELQDVSMSLRMVPVSSTFQKMKRIVRDMGKKLDKRVRLELIGEDTEVDKTIVDSISDPIMHIVRNSMDHGIENSEDERIAAGKDPVARILLSARHTGSEVIIEIIDDGRGASDEAILSKAVRQGLAQPGADYSHRDILSFLLMPGFSTNSEVTEYSGRGVGMDVVKSNVESVGGSVTVNSEEGKGMTTTLKIPLTMAIMDGMEVSVGDSIFTVPINNIRQIFKPSAKNVIHDPVHGEMMEVMSHFYPIVRAKEFFGMERGFGDFDDGILLWVESGENSFLLFVDELIGEQQVVVKPLPKYVNNFGIKNYGISGCTILGDGNISIILDIASIYAAAQTR